MRKINLLALWAFMMALSIVFLGCGGKEFHVPPWVEKPPEDPNYFYAIGEKEADSYQGALSFAKERARTELARSVRTSSTSMIKDFMKQVGTESTEDGIRVSEGIASEMIQYSRVAETANTKDGDLFRVFVLMEMSRAQFEAALVNAIKNKENKLTRLQAAEAYQELEDKVEKYEQYKKEQGLAP